MKYKDVVCLSMCDFFVTTRHEMSKIRILKLEDCNRSLTETCGKRFGETKIVSGWI